MMDDNPFPPWKGVYSSNNPGYMTSSENLDDLDATSPGTEAILADYLPPLRSKHLQYSPRHYRKAVNKPRILRDQSVVPVKGKNEKFLLEGTGSRLISKLSPDRNAVGNENTQSRCSTEEEEDGSLSRIPSSLAKNPKIFEAGLQKKERPKHSKLTQMKYNEKLRKEIELSAEKYIFTLQQSSMTSRGSKATESVHNLLGYLQTPAKSNGIHKNSSGDSRVRKQRLYGNTSGMKRNVEEPSINQRTHERHLTSPRKRESPKMPPFQLGPIISAEISKSSLCTKE